MSKGWGRLAEIEQEWSFDDLWQAHIALRELSEESGQRAPEGRIAADCGTGW